MTVARTLVESGLSKVSEVCRAIGQPRSSFYAANKQGKENIQLEQRAFELSDVNPGMAIDESQH